MPYLSYHVLVPAGLGRILILPIPSFVPYPIADHSALLPMDWITAWRRGSYPWDPRIRERYMTPRLVGAPLCPPQ